MKEQREKNEERGDEKGRARCVLKVEEDILKRRGALPWKLRPPSRNPKVAGVMR